MRVLVAYASADGSTADVAERIAARLAVSGHEVIARRVDEVREVAAFDAVVVGSAIHSRQWLDAATTFVDAHRDALRRRALFTFSVGMPDALPRFVRKLAGTEETAVLAALGDLRPVDHRLFSGVVKPSQFPFVSRVFLRLAGAHYGDFRDWPAIDGWAEELAERLGHRRIPLEPTDRRRADQRRYRRRLPERPSRRLR